MSEADLDAFASDWRALGTREGKWSAFVDRWGVRRKSPGLLGAFDFFTDECERLDPIGGAVLDLSRYVND